MFDSISNLEDAANELIEYLQEIEDDTFDYEDTIYRVAHEKTIEWVLSLVPTIVEEQAIYAATQTKEYNYDLFIERLESAIRRKIQEMVSITPYRHTRRRVKVIVDFTPLGNINDWGRAVKKVRKNHGWGLEKKRKGKPPLWTLGWYWRTMIYAPAREGAIIMKKNREGEITDEELKNQSKKYRSTIEERLACLPSDTAPFWYLINYGNANIKMVSNEGAQAYPDVSPTRFIDSIKDILREEYITSFHKFKEIATRVVSEKIAEEYEIKEAIYEDDADIVEAVKETVSDRLNSVLESGTGEKKTVGAKKIGDNLVKEVFVQGKQVQTRLRGEGGRFASKSTFSVE